MKKANTEYPVDPDMVAKILAASIPEEEFNTGLLGEDVLTIWQRGVKRVVASFRQPEVTGLWLEGSDDPIRVPLPGLVMIRTTQQHANAQYRFYAVKDRPTLKTRLYIAPLPHVNNNGSCWGTVTVKPTTDNDLTPDWSAFMGSRFGNHSVNGKSVSQPDDIRKLLIDLDKKGCGKYPMRDLVDLKTTFGEMLSEVCK
jgi:hypothetical protein